MRVMRCFLIRSKSCISSTIIWYNILENGVLEGGRWVGGVGEEIRCWSQCHIHEKGGGNGRMVCLDVEVEGDIVHRISGWRRCTWISMRL